MQAIRKAFCFLTTILVLLTSVIAAPIKAKTSHFFVSNFENVLGTSMEVKVKAFSQKQATVAEAKVLSEIKRLSSILSGYDANSEFYKWTLTNNKAVPVSDELFEVLHLFEGWKQKTNGALDPAAEAIGKLWKLSSLQNEVPSKEVINQTLANMNQQQWVLDAAHKTATHTSIAPLMLNTFVKSYIIYKAVEVAIANAGVEGIVLNIGGDIVVKGILDEKIAITNPVANAENDIAQSLIHVQNKAVATSGDYRRGHFIDGKWYSHIVDPRTGMPAQNIASATVIADDASTAGALATAFNILTPEASARLANELPGVDYMIVTKDGAIIKSNNWKNYEVVEAPIVAKKTSPVFGGWNTDYELIVNVELAQIAGFPRRPFVAIWVEGEDKKPVRTLTVWYNKPKWLRDLRAWYTANNDTYNDVAGNMPSIAGATRPAGKYAIKWDGKDDKGELVKTGKYTINIEVAREHGTYQLISQEIKCTGSEKQIELPANTEVAAASLSYKKKN
jgi:thiamine biosynthesis lipoprotein ApbE